MHHRLLCDNSAAGRRAALPQQFIGDGRVGRCLRRIPKVQCRDGPAPLICRPIRTTTTQSRRRLRGRCSISMVDGRCSQSGWRICGWGFVSGGEDGPLKDEDDNNRGGAFVFVRRARRTSVRRGRPHTLRSKGCTFGRAAWTCCCNINGGHDLQPPDCQSWAPLTMNVRHHRHAMNLIEAATNGNKFDAK